MNEQNKKFDLEERLIDFTVMCLSIAEKLANTRIGNYYSDQLIRSCSSPSLNYAEARSAESRRDFIHKMNICLKELRETNVTLKIIERKKLFTDQFVLEAAKKECNELISIFVTSVQTASANKKA